jgi:hypothetical protein
MAKLITVQFAIPDDDPCATQIGMAKEIQDMFDNQGVAGSFLVTKVENYEGDPIEFYYKNKDNV